MFFPLDIYGHAIPGHDQKIAGLYGICVTFHIILTKKRSFRSKLVSTPLFYSAM